MKTKLFITIFFVLINTYSLDLSTEETFGSYSGLTQVTWGLATFFSSLIAGFIAESISNNYGDTTMIISTTIAIAIIRALATIGYFFIKESLPKGKKIVEEKIQN